jgi:signal transduction histidine kinase
MEHDGPALGLRLARELHDGVLQTLTGASLQVEAILRRSHSDTATALRRLRGVLERIRGVWEVDFALDVHGVSPPPQMARTLARLVQEATVNAVRHGSASRVSVELAPCEGALVLRVSDNGSGFPFKGVLDHDELRERRLGPLSLKNRVEDAGWSLSIDSNVDGSTITVRAPSNGEPHS